MNSQIQYSLYRRLLLPFCFFVCMLLFYVSANAQEKPPKPISVTVSTLQNLNFGTFTYSGSSGTVSIDRNGVRSSTGDIILLSNIFPSAALYDVEAIPGTLITITNGPDIYLTGSNGGTLLLHIGDSFPFNPFIATGAHTAVTIGGTLTVGTAATNRPGLYGGTFSVKFDQQ